jgi:hypothetical protein
MALYWPVTSHDFVNYDDDMYVKDNPHVTSGLSAVNVSWAFRSNYAGNWHPVTWLSHMLDCQVFGLRPWGHHLTSVLFHAVNAGLVFLLLQQMTGARWRSLLVAALFALHPLRVESVAWVSERKDVLSAFFGLLALMAYVRYAQGRRQNAALTSWNEANGFKKLDSGDSTVSESSQRQIRNHLRSSNLQGSFLEEGRMLVISGPVGAVSWHSAFSFKWPVVRSLWSFPKLCWSLEVALVEPCWSLGVALGCLSGAYQHALVAL